MDTPETPAIPWEDIVAALLRHWKLIIAVLVAGMLVTAALALLQVPTYEATAKLMITSERARITVSPDPKSGPTVDRVTDQDLNSEVALLQSPALIREVLDPYRGRFEQPHPRGLAERVGALLRYPLELPTRLYRRLHNIAAVSPFEQWVRQTAAHMDVTPIKGSNLVEVSFTASRPQWAAEFVNQLAAHHVERHARLNQQSEALGFLESQRQLLNDKMRRAEEALAKFYDREGIDAASEQRSVLRARLAKLESTLASSQSQLAEATARAEFLRQDIRTAPRDMGTDTRAAQNSPLRLLRTRLLELQLQRTDLLSKFAPTSLKVQAIDRQIAEVKQLLAAEETRSGGNGGNPTLELDLSKSQEQIAAVKARIQTLQSQVAAYRITLDHLDRIAPEQERLEQDVATAKESFLTYSKKVEEARFSDALDQSRIVNVSVVERAEVPAAPQRTKRPMTFVLAALMSLTMGAGLAMLLDWINPTVKSASEAEKLTDLVILADIPS